MLCVGGDRQLLDQAGDVVFAAPEPSGAEVDRAALAAILDDAAGQLRSLAAAVDAGADSDE